MQIRAASSSDLDTVTAIEAQCFPQKEAATREAFAARLRHYPNHFWILEQEGQVIGFLNGLVTNRENLEDVMYEDASLHDEDGAWQMIFGLDTLPAYRRQGCAARLMEYAINESRRQQRKGLVLTCKEHLVHYYAKFGFVDEGVSGSTHGGVVWHQMRYSF